MPKPIQSKEDYIRAFSDKSKNAFNAAVETRAFEIELYWKRANYFWAIIAASFAGYFALSSVAKPNPNYIFLVCCIGSVLSTAWYLVNRGSKFWQENWESHVEVLEDEFVGPLFRTTISKDNFSLLKLQSGYPYSVTKINQLVSLFIAFVWYGLAFHSFPVDESTNYIQLLDNKWIAALTTFTFVFALLIWGRSSTDKPLRKINFISKDH